jgi:hypothetical protein
MDSQIEQLKQLSGLRDQGVLTDALHTRRRRPPPPN